MAKGEILNKVLTYVVGQIVDDPAQVEVTIIEQGPDEVLAEVRTGPGRHGSRDRPRGQDRPGDPHPGPSRG